MPHNETSPGFDLDTLDSADDLTQRVGVAFDEAGEPTVGFVIVGKDSAAYRETLRLQRVAGFKRRVSQPLDTATDEGAAEFERLLRANEDALVIAVVIDWFGFTQSGKPAPFSAAAVRVVLERRPTWRDRVLEALEQEEHFLPRSSAS